MKVRIIERFNDIETKEFYKLNKIIEISKERYEQIKKYVKKVEDNETFEESVKKSTRRKG